MLMLLHVCLAAMWLPGDAQPAACLDEDHCPSGFYCNRDVHHCHECLHCATFKRQEPDVPTPCVKSIVKCGPCFKGLEEPVDVNSACVPLVERAAESGTPGYVWVFVGLGVPVLVLLTAVVVWWALRNTETFKVIASTRTSVRPARPAAPSAPEQPPPYSEQYMPVRATSPGLPLYETNTEESEFPFIKPLPEEQRDNNREPEANQAANWYNTPNYVRLPPSHPGAQAAQAPVRDVTPERPALHDEDTMESVWTPGAGAAHNDNDTNNNSNSEASSSTVEVAPRRARPLDLTTHVPAKVLCIRRSSSASPPGSPPAPRRPRPPAVQQNIVINVTQNNFDADLATTHLH